MWVLLGSARSPGGQALGGGRGQALASLPRLSRADPSRRLQGLAALLLHCVLNREVRKHLRGLLAGKKPYADDSATTRATLLTVGGPRGPWGMGAGLEGRLDRHQTAPWSRLPDPVDVPGPNQSMAALPAAWGERVDRAGSGRSRPLVP